MVAVSGVERHVRIGLLGCGNVGAALVELVRARGDEIAARTGLRLDVSRVAVRSLSKERGVELDSDVLTTDAESVVTDPDVDLVVEVIGGIEPARELIVDALKGGKPVVTANKELLANVGGELYAVAESAGVDLLFEAAVAGGIPIVRPLRESLVGEDVSRVTGIVNGTTNYILTKMTEEGADFDDVLLEAQAKGYAEADPTNDVDGFDTSYKIAILASIAFGRQVPVAGIYREGIRNISKEDIHYAGVLGYVIKLLGVVQPIEKDKLLVRVHPTLLPKNHQLASVSGVYNALWIHGDFVGDLMFSGRGAGSDPTASAVVGDLIDVGRNMAIGGQGSAIPWELSIETEPIESLETEYYLRLIVQDRPKVLGQIAMILGEDNVSLAAMEMRVLDPEANLGEIVFLTHRCKEGDFRRAIAEIEKSEIVERVCSWIRVES